MEGYAIPFFSNLETLDVTDSPSFRDDDPLLSGDRDLFFPQSDDVGERVFAVTRLISHMFHALSKDVDILVGDPKSWMDDAAWSQVRGAYLIWKGRDKRATRGFAERLLGQYAYVLRDGISPAENIEEFVLFLFCLFLRLQHAARANNVSADSARRGLTCFKDRVNQLLSSTRDAETRPQCPSELHVLLDAF